MEYYDLGELVEGIFIKRLNRFAALVEMAGKAEEVHVANSGRMTELLPAGVRVWLKESKGVKRKTKHDLLLVEYEGRRVFLNAHLANDFLQQWLESKCLAELKMYDEWKREYKWENSRFDFLLAKGEEKLLLEVKSVNYLLGDYAVFPDAPTQRGSRHLLELKEWQSRGLGKSAVCFIVMGHDAKKFRTNAVTDPQFAQNLAQVYKDGVAVLVYKCYIKENKVYFDGEIAF